MATTTSTFAGRIYLVLIHAALIYLIVDKAGCGSNRPANTEEHGSALPAGAAIMDSVRQPAAARPVDTLTVYQSSVSAPGDTGKLMVPVLGVKRAQLTDTYEQSRAGGGRIHHAIDIPAPAGTPVLATANGAIAKLFDSKDGGITIYQWSADKQRVYYYAHLQRRADGLTEGAVIRQGAVIGYVGDTGNAGTGNFHLHFSVSIPTSADRYWGGEDLNPYPLLISGIEAAAE